MQYGSLEIVCEQKVAAAADVKNRTGQFLKLDIDKIRHRIILDETSRLHLHAEGVHLSQILVIFRVYHRTLIYIKW